MYKQEEAIIWQEYLNQIKCVTGKELKHNLNVRKVCRIPPATASFHRKIKSI
jgi:hypothetical protein